MSSHAEMTRDAGGRSAAAAAGGGRAAAPHACTARPGGVAAAHAAIWLMTLPGSGRSDARARSMPVR